MITVMHKVFKIWRTNVIRYISSDSDKDFFLRLNKSHLNNSLKNNDKLLMSVNNENEYSNIHLNNAIEDVNFIEKNGDIDIKITETEKRLRKDKMLQIINSPINDDQYNSNNFHKYKTDLYSKRLTKESIICRSDNFPLKNDLTMQRQPETMDHKNSDYMALKTDFTDQSIFNQINDLCDQFHTIDKKISSNIKPDTLINSSLHTEQNNTNDIQDNSINGKGRKNARKCSLNIKSISKDSVIVSTDRIINKAITQPQYETVEIFKNLNNKIDSEMKDEIKESNTQISIESLKKEIDEIELDEVENTPTKLLNIAPIIEKNTTLLNLLKYGVDLYEIETNRNGVNMLARLNWDTQVLPLISFMKEQANFEDRQLAIIFSYCPKIFRKNLVDIEEIFVYLKSRNFNSSDLTSIICSNTSILNLTKTLLEKRFQEVEELIDLTTEEMNKLVIKFSRILVDNMMQIKHAVHQLHKAMGFTREEVKNIVMDSPKVLMQHKDDLSINFTFLHRALNMSHEAIVISSSALCLPSSTLSERVKYLIFLKRFQTDPHEPLYTPIQNIASVTEAEFCEKIAHTSITKFRKFVKTL